jgi:ABC-type polysaccharide/polyol phosphate export permease
MIEVIMSAWFYLTPIIYPFDMIPSGYKILFKLNPLFYIIDNFRDVMFYGRFPSLSFMINSILAAILSFIIGYWYFYRNEKEIIYYI